MNRLKIPGLGAEFAIMLIVVLVIHVMLTVALIAVVLVQKSEGGALGIGGGGMSGLMTGRSTANFLTRMTAMLAAGFMTTSILLAVLHAPARNSTDSILNSAPTTPASAPAPAAVPAPVPAAPTDAKPAAPQPPPAVPIAK
jgi:preprotein translocase subunit SecG